MSPHTNASSSCDSSPLRACFLPSANSEQTGRILDDLKRYEPGKIEHDDEGEEEADILMLRTTKRLRSPHKKLFGENGWLGRNPSVTELSNGQYTKKPGFKTFGEKVKQHVEGLVRLSPTSIFQENHVINNYKGR